MQRLCQPTKHDEKLGTIISNAHDAGHFIRPEDVVAFQVLLQDIRAKGGGAGKCLVHEGKG